MTALCLLGMLTVTGSTWPTPQQAPTITFTDVTADAGIHFVHFHGERTGQLAEDMGSGAAWGDYDNDGWLDLFVVNEAGSANLTPAQLAESPAHAHLYHNDGDGSFTEVSHLAGVDFRGIGMGALWGDYDNDGWPDLFVTAYGENVLYHNEGDGTFTDRSRPSGIAAARRGFWAGAAWGDYDRDGFLDLYVTGYVEYAPGQVGTMSMGGMEIPAALFPMRFRPHRNVLFHNQGDGTFTEVSHEAGVEGHEGRSLEAVWTDVDGDGWADLFVANDASGNALFRNRGDGTFEDLSRQTGMADPRGAMGLAVGDWDGDEDLDIYITHWIGEDNALFSSALSNGHRRRGRRAMGVRYQEDTEASGLGELTRPDIGWGTSFIDVDNDAWLDLFVVNGSTFQQEGHPERLVAMRDRLFRNRGSKRGFREVSRAAGAHFARALVGRGAAFADYDNDGDVDAFIVNHGGPAVLLRNDSRGTHRWLEIELEGGRSNRSAIGAKLWLIVDGAVQIREIGAQGSYLSQNALRVHFGLGDHDRVERLVVVWPSGTRQSFRGLRANRRYRLVEGERIRDSARVLKRQELPGP